MALHLCHTSSTHTPLPAASCCCHAIHTASTSHTHTIYLLQPHSLHSCTPVPPHYTLAFYLCTFCHTPPFLPPSSTLPCHAASFTASVLPHLPLGDHGYVCCAHVTTTGGYAVVCVTFHLLFICVYVVDTVPRACGRLRSSLPLATSHCCHIRHSITLFTPQNVLAGHYHGACVRTRHFRTRIRCTHVTTPRAGATPHFAGACCLLRHADGLPQWYTATRGGSRLRAALTICRFHHAFSLPSTQRAFCV